MTKKLVFGVAGMGLLVLLILALRPKPLEVDVAAVTRGPLHQTVEEDGKTRVRERYTVSAPLAGTLARIEMHAGDPVEPGTVVARLQPLPSPLLDPRAREVAEQRLASARDAHSQAVAAVARGEASSQLAGRNVDRDRELVKKNALPELQLEQAETESRMQASELELLRFAEKVAAHGVDEAKLALESFSAKQGAGEQLLLTSPIHGVVLHVLHENGGVVTAGQALLELGDPASLEVVVEVLSQDAVSLRPGMSATLTHWGGEGEIRAHVRRVEPAAFTHLSVLGVEEQRVNVLLDLDESGAAGKLLGDGFALEAKILTWSAEEVAQIPTSALFRQGNGWAVFVVGDGQSVVRPVKIGHRGPLLAEVLEGLGPGDQVIVHPAPALKAGTRVRPRGT